MAQVTIRLQLTLPRAIADGLKLFEAATISQKLRQRRRGKPGLVADRGWRREDAYTRGRVR